MIYKQINKACLLSCILVGAGTSFAGTMGDVQDDSKRYFFSASAVYARLSDESLNKFAFVDTQKVTPGVNAVGVTTHTADVDPKWGYALSLGYQFGPQLSHDLVLSYTNLENNGIQVVGNSNPGDIMKNSMSIVMGNFDNNPTFRGPAVAAISSRYEYQSGELITHRNIQSKFSDQIRFTRYFGIKATEIKKAFEASYVGNQEAVGNFPVADNMQYSSKFLGIGPKAGAGAYWDFNRYFSIGGDLSFAILGGSNKSQINESLVTGGQVFNLPASHFYTFNQAYSSSLWVAPVLGSNLVVAANFDFNAGSRVGFEAGLNTEQYWSDTSNQKFSRREGANSVSVHPRFSLRNAFLKATYYC